MLLTLGLTTRLSALALLIMTGIIQLTAPSGWANFHPPRAALALTLTTLGAGPLSLEFASARQLDKPRQPSQQTLSSPRPA